jgi:hypothetical protein
MSRSPGKPGLLFLPDWPENAGWIKFVNIQPHIHMFQLNVE